MKRFLWSWLALSLLPLADMPAQGVPANPHLDLGFEAAECAGGWYASGRGYEARTDTQVFRSGRSSLRMRYTAQAPWTKGFRRYGMVSRPFPIEAAAGHKVRFSGAIRTEGISQGYAGLWWSADGEEKTLASDNMEGRGPSGTTPWTRYQIEIEVPKEAKHIYFGALLRGDGTAWFDDLRVEIDGVRWVEGPPAPATPGKAAVAWLREHAIPFSTPEAGHGFADLQPLKRLIGNARIVALGEGTHGTREFFQMKHRLIEFLASQMGFTLFAIEANMPEAYRVNDYVLHGKGDPKELLEGMYVWTWNTQEVLDLIEWMRAFNQSGKGRIQFLGFDMQGARVSAQIVRDFAMKAEPDWAASLGNAFAEIDETRQARRDIGAAAAPEEAVKAAEEARKRSHQAAKDVLAHLEAGRQGYLARFPKEEVEWVIQNARVALQAAELGEGGLALRDRSMARNVEWILDQAPPGAKIVLWAHNAHVSREEGAMGSFLAERFGKEMFVVGLAFGRGTYTAMGDQGLGTHEAVAATPGSVESYLAAAGLPRFVLDLRGIPAASPAAPWLVAERPFRSIGAVAVRCAFHPTPVASHYDGLIWLAETSHSVTLP